MENPTDLTTEPTEPVTVTDPVAEPEQAATTDQVIEKGVEPTTDTEPKVESEPNPEQEKKTAEPETDSDSETDSEERTVPQAADYVLPKGVPQHIAEFAHKNDMTQSQLDHSLHYFMQMSANDQTQNKNQIAVAGKALVDSWGAEAKNNLKMAKQALKQYDTDGSLTKILNTTGYGGHPALINTFLNIAKANREGAFMRGRPHVTPGKVTAATAMFGQNHPSI